MLASPAFRNSKQCQKFLNYVVEHSLTHEEERLKERTIGVEVFGRDADYDTASDPVVRVRATEIRKRVAQYYDQASSAKDVRIEIPSGAYHAEFHFGDKPSKSALIIRSRRWAWLSALPIVLGLYGSL